jgi:hypothetical protein
VPTFGSSGLAAIRPTMVQQWVKDLQGIKSLAPRTIEAVYVNFASIMPARSATATPAKRPASTSAFPASPRRRFVC